MSFTVISFVRRHHLVLPVFLAVITAALASWQGFAHAGQPDVVPPARVIVDQAEVIDQGIRITWLKAQDGSSPISRYIIEKSRAGSDFKEVGYVSNELFSYIDTNGQAQDAYRIIAEDNQQPAHHSAPSENAVGTPPKAGNAVVLAPATAGRPKSPDPSGTPEMQAAQLLTSSSNIFATFQGSLAKKDMPGLENQLALMQKYQQQILMLLPRLSSPQKTLLIQVYANQANVFAMQIHQLPESLQMDGLLVQAGYKVIQGTT
jgi:hypothetical protein